MRTFSILTFTATLFAIAQSVPLKAHKEISTNVLILGGGMAGIKAASTLAHDLAITDFLVVEARHELGGRMQNIQLGDSGMSVEIGANWIQGLGTNPIWALTNEYGIRNVYSNWSDIEYFDQDGWQGVKGAIEQAFDLFDGPIFDALTELAQSGNRSHEADIDMRTALRLVGWRGQTSAEWAAEYFEFDWEQAEPPSVSSLYHFIASYTANFEEFGDGDNNFAIDPRGFKQIVQGQARDIPNFKKKVLFDHTVATVEYSDDGVVAATTEGVVIRAKYAICTFSAGVLQNTDVVFKPDFPRWKSTAVAQLHMATYMKIFASFPTVFWNVSQFQIYGDPAERGYYSVWQNLDVEGIYPGSKTLLATLTYDQAFRAEHQTDDEVKEEFMDVLRNMYGADIPDPAHFLVPRWTINPLFRGTFSNWGAGMQEETLDRVVAPLGGTPGRGRLFFAGEHCSRKYFGFLQGAYYSGQLVANQIADCIRHDCVVSRRTAALIKAIEDAPDEHFFTKTSGPGRYGRR